MEKNSAVPRAESISRNHWTSLRPSFGAGGQSLVADFRLKALLNLSSIWITGGGFDGGTAYGWRRQLFAGERPMVDLGISGTEIGLRIADLIWDLWPTNWK
jgi:hypothetical protein